MQVLFLVVLVEAHDLHVRPELVEHLTARAAGVAVVVTASRDDDALEAPVPLAHGLERRGALGAVRQAVARIFDIAAGEDRTVLTFERRTHGKVGVRHIGHVQHGDGLRLEFF